MKLKYPFRTKQIEKKTEDIILQKGIEITLAGKTYNIERASIATWIEMSTLLSKLKSYPKEKESNFIELIAIAGDDLSLLVDIIVLLIFTAKKQDSKGRKDLAQYIRLNAGADEIIEAFGKILKEMSISEVFLLTASLKEMNLSKSTRQTEAVATAFGQE